MTPRLLVMIVAFVGLHGCGAARPYTSPGTLYLELYGSGNRTIRLKDGKVVGTPMPEMAVARDYPERSWKTDDLHPGGGCDPYTYRLSPDGDFGLCASRNGFELHLFQPARVGSDRVVLTNFVENADQTSFGWLNSRKFVALVLDKACPYAHLYDFFPTRLAIFDYAGHHLATGRCAYGVVTGRDTIALQGERPNDFLWNIEQLFGNCPAACNDGYDSFHQVWSVDGGKSWHAGQPLAFDGNDLLLYWDQFGKLIRSERGDVVFKGNVFNVQWSR